MTDDDLHEDAEAFLYDHFRSEYTHDPNAVTADEEAEIESIVQQVAGDLDRNVGILGIALDFLIVSEELSQVDSWAAGVDLNIQVADILDHYDRRDTNTLTILFDGDRYGIRPVQSEVRDLFIYDLRRTNFPSSPGHHTGNWRDYTELLERAFRLARPGRFEACRRLFDLGMQELDEKRYEQREPAFETPFLDIIRDYQRSHPDENGGLAFQAMAYGFVKAEWSHLSLRASKVRTGSSQQNRYGDIDGFLGPDLMISVEAKNLDIDQSNVKSELGIMSDLAANTTTLPIAVCRSVTTGARETLESDGVQVMDDDDLVNELCRWDYHKQDRATQGMLHYLANIEENPDAVQRLLRFLEEVDVANRALDHLLD
jgi:hypothetical protein